MFNYFEKIAKLIYHQKKAASQIAAQKHPSEEDLACFLEDKLSKQEKQVIQEHLLNCDACAEYVAVQLKIQPRLSLEVPDLLLEKVKKIAGVDIQQNLFEIFVKLKDKALEIIQTTGDVLVGQELIPAPILRSRQINEFKEEVSILKDFEKIRVLVKIQNKSAKCFNLTVTVKDKKSHWAGVQGLASNNANQKIYKNLRVTLIKNEIELESYLADSGNSFFENIQPGDYIVQISRENQPEAAINLKIKV